ncbi:patatin-like phospholipase family protein [Sphingobacterium paludis]|uniref:NTE family protein n=1 Tax=Sphingobacterium paludis TaxID=1476465 RepID=A0A4R7CTV2_9SPHI|nr:patatin-like phospholipase family protein [Sphingobacterium paludis]TDS11853.1 NTE family protein [Sphingobacterium paludis]
MQRINEEKKVSLVLGSGGARGITQIGVIQYLVEQGYIIDEIVGCSIGALVGAAYACNRVVELGDWMKTLTKGQVFRLLDFTNPRFGLLKGQRIIDKLHTVFDDVNIEDLPFTYTAVATDLDREEEVVFTTGSIYTAIRASIAIPGVFAGVVYDDRFLVDGGVLNPLPLNHVTKKDNIIIAVNLDGRPNKETGLVAKLNPVALLQESYFAMRRRLSILTLAHYQPDFTITIPHDSAGIWDFHRSIELIDMGYNLAHDILELEKDTSLKPLRETPSATP